MTGNQMERGGYEDIFKRDFNNDGITGTPPAVDDNGDGLIDNSSTYKLFKDDDAIALTNRRGGSFSDRSSRLWDITQHLLLKRVLRCCLRRRTAASRSIPGVEH